MLIFRSTEAAPGFVTGAPECGRYRDIKFRHTVKRVDEVVRHPHVVTQDQFTQVSKKVFDIPAEDFTINIDLFLHTFTNVELVRQNWFVSKATSPGCEPRYSVLLSDALPLRPTLFLHLNSFFFTLYSLFVFVFVFV